MVAVPDVSIRRTVALACRVLARAGLVENVLGHVSARTGPDRMLIRCRGPRERGLLFALRLAAAGGSSRTVPEEDLAELPDLGGGLNDQAVWRFHVARLEHEGLGLISPG